MKKNILLLMLLLAVFPITAGNKKNADQLPKDHLLTIENETGHKLFIVEEKSFKMLNPQDAVVLYWNEPLTKSHERVIKIYYGGNIKNNTPDLTNKKAKIKRLSKKKSVDNGPQPVLIAQLSTNKPGTISLRYDQNGILKMERI